MEYFFFLEFRFSCSSEIFREILLVSEFISTSTKCRLDYCKKFRPILEGGLCRISGGNFSEARLHFQG